MNVNDSNESNDIDNAFMHALEACTLEPSQFNHAGHIRAAYHYLQRLAFLEACIAMRDTLQRFAASMGKTGLYHETITIAFMSLVAERMVKDPGEDSAAFLVLYPELLDKVLLTHYYDAQVLDSDFARRHFVLGSARHL